MKPSSLPVKRRSVKKGALRTFFVNVARKRHRAATAAAPMPDIEGDVPNVGVARALVVILAIHIVAIAGIFVHSRFFEEKEVAVAEKPMLLAPVAPKAAENTARLPKITADKEPYIVSAGESYATIAATLVGRGIQVTEEELRQANGNIEVYSGLILGVPRESSQRIVAMDPPEFTALRGGAAVVPELAVVTDPQRDEAPMVETTAVAVDRAMLVRPQVTRAVAEPPASQPPAVESRTPRAEASMGGSYTVKAGDTLWRISQAHGTTPDALMKANGIKDPSKLRIGMKLKVPGR